MFIDNVELTISSGKGGAGCVSFRREKFVPKGGPDGGDGGNGGDVYFFVDNNTHTLSHFKGKRHLKAKNGQMGMGRRKHGKKGEDLIIKVPPGTQVIDVLNGEVLLDLTEPKEKVLFLKGGKGGLGNWHFRSSSNQKPTYAQPGLEGRSIKVRLELKLIADVGLVGFPNVGKSTLISTVSNASPEIANYEFTTLTPKLGIVKAGDFDSFVMADIPGIIEGASEGKGLGLEFLRHIERTKFLLFMLDIANYRTLENQFRELKRELSKFSEKLSKRAFAIAFTRVDALLREEAVEKIEKFLKTFKLDRKEVKNDYGFSKEYPYFLQNIEEYDIKTPFFAAPISSVSGLNISPLIFALNDAVKFLKRKENEDSKESKENSN